MQTITELMANKPQRPRSSYSRSSAIRFLPIFNACIRESKQQIPKSVFVKYTDYSLGSSPTSFNTKFMDALLWLRKNNLGEDNKDDNGQPYTTLDYEMLFKCMKKSIEAEGLRLHVVPSIAEKFRESVEVERPTDWQSKVVAFLEGDAPVLQLENLVLTNESPNWLKDVCGKAGAEYVVDGDKLTIVKGS